MLLTLSVKCTLFFHVVDHMGVLSIVLVIKKLLLSTGVALEYTLMCYGKNLVALCD